MTKNICGATTLNGELCTHPINPATQNCSAGHTPQNRTSVSVKDLVHAGGVSAENQGTIDFDEVASLPASMLPEHYDVTAPWPTSISPDTQGRSYFLQDKEFSEAQAKTEEAYSSMDFRDLEAEHFRVDAQWLDLLDRKKTNQEDLTDFDRQVLDAEEIELKNRREILADKLTRTPNLLNLDEQNRLREAKDKSEWLERCDDYDRLSDKELASFIETYTASYFKDQDNEKHRDGPMTSGSASMYALRMKQIEDLNRYQAQRAKEANLSVEDMFERRNQAETLSRFITQVSNKTKIPDKADPVARGTEDKVGQNLDNGRDEYRRAMATRIEADKASVAAAKEEAKRYQKLIAKRG